MLRLRSKSTDVLFGVAFIAVSMLASPSFAISGGGNADEIPLVTHGNRVGSAQASFPARTATMVGTSNQCHDGYRWISRDPHPFNGDPEAFSMPQPCK